jgi:hypothetical protein
MSDYVTIMSIMSITHSGQLCLIISLPGNEQLLQLCQYYYVSYVLWDLLGSLAILLTEPAQLTAHKRAGLHLSDSACFKDLITRLFGG